MRKYISKATLDDKKPPIKSETPISVSEDNKPILKDVTKNKDQKKVVEQPIAAKNISDSQEAPKKDPIDNPSPSIPQVDISMSSNVEKSPLQTAGAVAPKKTQIVAGPKQQEYSQSERDKAVIEVRDLVKNFHVGTQEINVLKGINVQINQGDFLVILGPSGCGKSTLLHTLLGLEYPTTGEVKFLGKNIYDGTSEDDRTQFRKEHVGMIYQQPNWIKSMTVIENVAFPLVLRGYQKEMAQEIAHEALDLVHMTNWETQIPTELSGGQQQRVAVARCVVHNPEVIVADEPTGNLDYESGIEVMELLQRMNVENKKTMIMVTHDIEYVKYATCAIRIFDGRVLGYFTKNNMNDLMSQLQTKRLDKSQLEENK